MGVRLGSVFSSAIVGSPAAAAETAICTTGALNLALDNAQVLLFWYCVFTVGTNGVSYTVRLHRANGLAGSALNVPTAVTAVAANVVTFGGCYADSPGLGAGLQYTLSLQVGSATAASTIGDVALLAMVL